MGDPAVTICPQGQWTKVAEDVSTTTLHKLSNAPGAYLYTYRDTGEAAPTSQAEGVPIFLCTDMKKLWPRSTNADIYIWPTHTAGQVRADGDVGDPRLFFDDFDSNGALGGKTPPINKGNSSATYNATVKINLPLVESGHVAVSHDAGFTIDTGDDLIGKKITFKLARFELKGVYVLWTPNTYACWSKTTPNYNTCQITLTAGRVGILIGTTFSNPFTTFIITDTSIVEFRITTTGFDIYVDSVFVYTVTTTVPTNAKRIGASNYDSDYKSFQIDSITVEDL